MRGTPGRALARAGVVIGAVLAVLAVPVGSAAALDVDLPLPVQISVPGVVDVNATAPPAQATARVDATTTPSAQLAPGPVAGLPGADAQVPARADASVAAAPLARAQAHVDGCVAASVLSGHPLAGCDAPPDSPRALVDSLTSVGACAQFALASAQPLAVCGAPAQPGDLTADAVAALESDAQVCSVAGVLGLVDPGRCTQAAGTAASELAAAGTDAAASTQVCLGLAVLTTGAVARCGDVSAPGASTVTGSTPGSTPSGEGAAAGVEGTDLLAGSRPAATSAGSGSSNLATTGIAIATLLAAALALIVFGFGGTRLSRLTHRTT